MMFLVIAKDCPDALERRMACREAHVQLIDDLKAKGHLKIGGALLDDGGNMMGSAIVGNFLSKEALEDQWLKHEPYLTHEVWGTVEIYPYSLGPSFIGEF